MFFSGGGLIKNSLSAGNALVGNFYDEEVSDNSKNMALSVEELCSKLKK